MENSANFGTIEQMQATDHPQTVMQQVVVDQLKESVALPNSKANIALPDGFPTISLFDNGIRATMTPGETAPDAPSNSETAPDAPIEARITRSGANSETAPDAPVNSETAPGNPCSGKEGLEQAGKEVFKEMQSRLNKSDVGSLGNKLSGKTKSELKDMLENSAWAEGLRSIRPNIVNPNASKKAD